MLTVIWKHGCWLWAILQPHICMSNALDSSQMGVVKSIVLFFNLELKLAIFQQKMNTSTVSPSALSIYPQSHPTVNKLII